MPETSFPRTELDPFDLAVRAARTRQRIFLLMAVAWLAGAVLVGFLFNQLTQRVSEAWKKAEDLEGSLRKQKQTAEQLVATLQTQQAKLSTMERSLRLTEEALLNSLPEERRREFALQLAETQSEQLVPTKETPRGKTDLSPVLKNFLRDEGQRKSSDSSENHFLAGSSLLAEKKYQEALKEFEASITADPKAARAYVARAFVYNELQRYQEAIADCNKAIALNSKDAAAYNNRGWAQLHLKHYDDAIADFTAAISHENAFLYYANRAAAYVYIPKYAEAIQDYREAARIDPSKAWVNREIARLEWKLGHFDDALKAVNLVIKTDPNSSA